MATVKCNSCRETHEVSFYECWTCDLCGGDWSIRLEAYAPTEIQELLAFYQRIRDTHAFSDPGTVFALSKELENPDDTGAFTSYIDTLLLFFDSVIVPSITVDQLVHALGEQKYEAYCGRNLLKCSDISLVQARAFGVENIGTGNEQSLFDLDLIGNALPRDASSSYGHSRFELAMSLDNLEHVIRNELLAFVNDRNFINAHRIGDSSAVRLRGRNYVDSDLVYVVPSRFMRSEIFCHFFSSSLLYDQYYGVANVMKQTRFLRSWPEGDSEFALFTQWLKTTQFKTKVLDYAQVLEFRAKHGSLTDYILAIRRKAATRTEGFNHCEEVEAFGAEIEKRIHQALKVSSKAHERKTLYLSGLLSTLGSLVNGPVGAVIGGIGGTVAADLALEYDRRIPGPISFVADELLDV